MARSLVIYSAILLVKQKLSSDYRVLMLYCNYSIATLKWLKSIRSDKGHDAIPSKSTFHQQEHENFQIAMSKLTLKKNYVHTQNRQHLLQSTTSYISTKHIYIVHLVKHMHALP